MPQRTSELTEMASNILLSIGQAGNVPHISVERMAVNLDNCLGSDGMNVLPDSAGVTAYLAARQGNMPTGFVHVPFLPEQLDKDCT